MYGRCPPMFRRAGREHSGSQPGGCIHGGRRRAGRGMPGGGGCQPGCGGSPCGLWNVSWALPGVGGGPAVCGCGVLRVRLGSARAVEIETSSSLRGDQLGGVARAAGGGRRVCHERSGHGRAGPRRRRTGPARGRLGRAARSGAPNGTPRLSPGCGRVAPPQRRRETSPGTRGASQRSSVLPAGRSRVIRRAGTSCGRGFPGQSRRRRCSGRSSNRLGVGGILLPGSNCLSQTNRVPRCGLRRPARRRRAARSSSCGRQDGSRATAGSTQPAIRSPDPTPVGEEERRDVERARRRWRTDVLDVSLALRREPAARVRPVHAPRGFG